MIDDGPRLLTIGQLSRRTGLSVRTIRYWSDVGALPPVGRSPGGYRLYDAQSLARLELIRTLRELGLGLDDVRSVVDGESDIASVAAAHVAALDAQIRSLRLNRAVLSTVAKRNSNAEEMALMNKLARLSAAERKQIIDDFMEQTFGGLDAADPDIRTRMRVMVPDLPDDPTTEQVDAWVELAELMQDPGFRAHMRSMIEFNAADRGPDVPPGSSLWFMSRLVQLAGEARERGVAPESPEAEEVLRGLLGAGADLAAVLERMEAAANADVARFRDLVSLVRGLETLPRHNEEFAWVVAALRARTAR
ncbi:MULTISPECIES: MerR family transcriptional regulator [unclassified Streptomyces]|uniref:helix-turn-helix domain-containing protein n=1 Tax=unclassified Streptomyces TaxID=2593676 RepID=UPI00224DB27E|nr:MULTISPECIES: MerR family transcriptional regulator [unclassified Streptomyces]MCX5439743.1 MerR family transcriptional regulator [Streptomyces sp. NBC_00063]WSE17291.1 MerR family transcriptional regulator [Streptomyces sp. NBC_01397]WUB93816.1 MerR family transcriptional regulator [Streptomyces sp. NBC_00569]